MSNKKQSTYSLDENIKRDFQVECLLNDVNMSEAVEALMENYITISRKIRAEQHNAKEAEGKHWERNITEAEFIHSLETPGRLDFKNE